jgi:uncharacterized membrane protein YvlD (DUF360 family)
VKTQGQRLKLAGGRIAGLLILTVCFAIYDPQSASVTNRLALPLIMALGAWALVQNTAIVALATALLAGLASNPGSGFWIEAYAYPLLATVAAITFAAITAQRFRQRIQDTHAARWSNRQ